MEPFRHQHIGQSRLSSTSDRKTLLQDPMNFPMRRKKAPKGIPHWVRVLLRVFSLGLSLTIIGLLVHTLILYNKTKDDRWQYPKGSMLPAWPRPGPVMRPIYVMLLAAGIGAILNILALITLCGAFKKVRASAFGPLSAISSCFIAFAVSTAAVVYYKLWDTKIKHQTDVWMWTCHHKEFEVTAGGTEFDFSKICIEMTYVWYAGMAIGAIELLNLIACLYNTIKIRVVEPKDSYMYHTVERETFIERKS